LIGWMADLRNVSEFQAASLHDLSTVVALKNASPIQMEGPERMYTVVRLTRGSGGSPYDPSRNSAVTYYVVMLH
jgi:hypothetical protein